MDDQRQDMLEYVKRATTGVPPEFKAAHRALVKQFMKQALATASANNQTINWQKFQVPPFFPPAPNGMLVPPPPSGAPKQPPQLKPKPAIAPMRMSAAERAKAEKRRARFEQPPVKKAKQAMHQPNVTVPAAINSGGMGDTPLVGQCQDLEKQYLRLTSAADPRFVRPKRILKKAFPYVIGKFESGERDYAYIQSQLKSIRQDMKVQGLEDGFTLAVYEKNARIAMMQGDFGEFNQCIRQLVDLYKMPHLAYALGASSGEYFGYSIYYTLYTRAFQDLDLTLINLSSDERLRGDPKIQLARQICDAIFAKNMPLFFALYRKADKFAQTAMGPVVDRERLVALASICKAKKQANLTVDSLTPILAFSTDDETLAFLRQYTSHIDAEDQLVCKHAAADFEKLCHTQQKIDIKGQV